MSKTGKLLLVTLPADEIQGDKRLEGKFPVLYSETDFIEVGNPWVNFSQKKLHFQATEQDVKNIILMMNFNCRKVTALPEDFSTEQIIQISSGSLQEGQTITL